MNRNRLTNLFILAAALIFSGCGGGAERSGGDTKAAAASPRGDAASPTPAAVGGANAVATPASDATTVPASGGEAAARQDAPSAPAPRGAGSAPPAKMPTPQIGSGGTDFFLFTQARAAINGDSELKAANVVIEVKGGVVTLSGTVASAALKSKAEQLARDAGSKEVRNQLRVSAGR